MQKLGLNNSVKTSKNGFWKRQFQAQSTTSQKTFDWIFGVFLPVICFVFDPTVFKNSGFGETLLGTYKPFAYLLSFVSVMAMAAWLIWGAKLIWFNGFLAGLFLCGAIVSLIVGVCLFPFSVIGLVVLIGILGFTPLFSSFVYLRNVFRSYQAAKPVLEKSVLIYLIAFGAIFSAIVPSVINLEINRSLENIRLGDAQTVREESQKLKYVAPLVVTENLLWLYRTSSEAGRNGAEKKQAIAEFYKEMTGEEMENKIRRLTD